ATARASYARCISTPRSSRAIPSGSTIRGAESGAVHPVGALLLLLALEERDPLLHPLRLRRPLEVVVEELLHPQRVVLLVGTPAEPVQLAVVAPQVDFLAAPAQR